MKLLPSHIARRIPVAQGSFNLVAYARLYVLTSSWYILEYDQRDSLLVWADCYDTGPRIERIRLSDLESLNVGGAHVQCDYGFRPTRIADIMPYGGEQYA